MKQFLQQFRLFQKHITNSAFAQFIVIHKRSFSALVIIAFFVFFGYYIYVHPEVLHNVAAIGPVNTVLLLVLYFFIVLTNFGILYATISLCRKKLSPKSGLLLTMYSSIVNFFGPLQSGPGVRAVYLKTKIGLRIRDFTYAMLFYYLSFAALNASLLFINKLPWLTVIGIIMTILFTIAGTRKLGFGSRGVIVFSILIMTALQVIGMIIIYGIELSAVDPSAHYSIYQMMSYTASANLSLFVSLTPGGIGIREAFLVFAGSLHNVSLSSIVAAGILDRALYIIFLVLLFIVSSGLNLKDMFVSKK